LFQEIRLGFLPARLPLFHRLWAGIAKVKIKVEAHEGHVYVWVLQGTQPNSAINHRIWQVI
jgi:hypothetical protein